MAKNERRADEANTVEGLVSHIELFSSDPRRSAEFFSKVLGWECEEYELNGQPYMGWRCPDGGVPGGFRRMDETGRAGTINYVKTFDMEKVLRLVQERGGTITLQKTRIPGIGYIARFNDPFGNLVGVFEPE